MPNNKFKVGDKIGPFQIELVEILGSRNGHNYGYFICPNCPEHTKFLARISHIASGQIQSCGCILNKTRQRVAAETGRNNKINMLGQKFGHLTVIEETNKRVDRKVIWKCVCDCKNHTVVYASGKLLRSGEITSCGCIKSQGEQQIQKLLDQWNIEYFREYKFKDCINPKTNRRLRFDFYLPSYNLCIEYDGEQHFTGWRGKDDLEDIRYKDNIKNEYCIKNNIFLIRIKYSDYNKLFYLKNLKKLLDLNYNFKAKN